MNRTLILIALWILVGCSGLPLADRELRQKTFMVKTSVAASTAYQRGVAWTNKKLLPLEGTAMEQIPAEGKFSIQSQTQCHTLLSDKEKENDELKRFLAYKLTFTAKDKQAVMVFEDIRMLDDKGILVQDGSRQISSLEKMDGVEPCLNSVVKPLSKSLEKSKINWE